MGGTASAGMSNSRFIAKAFEFDAASAGFSDPLMLENNKL
jgi:hypothetical protein